MSDPTPPDPVVGDRRARVAVAVLFVLAGAVMGGWAGRIPSVKHQVGLGDGAWGVVILAQPIGTLLVLLLLPRLITRTGARSLALPGATVVLAITPITALASHWAALAVSLLIQGMGVGLLFSPMNALAVIVERRYRRSIMSSFHASFSLGQLGGGLAGVLAGSLAIRPSIQLAVTNVVLAGLLLVTARSLPHDRPHPANRSLPAERRSVRAAITPQLLLLATIGLLTSINEGSATQWSAQYSVSLGSTVAVGSLTLVCYSLSIALIRLRGDRLVERLGRVRFLTISATVSAVGMGSALLVGTIPLALVGFALLGLGSGCIVPTVIGLAGNQPDVPSSRGVALVSLGEWPAFLLGPPVIGALAEWVSLRGALGLLVVGSLLILVAAGRIVAPPRRDVRRAWPP